MYEIPVKSFETLEKIPQTRTRTTSSNHLFDDRYYQDRIFHMTGVKMQIASLLQMRNQVTKGAGDFASFPKHERAKQMNYILRKLRKLGHK